MPRKKSPFDKDHEANEKARLVHILTLQRGECRWPIDTDEGIRFCGRKVEKLSWCKEHAEIGIASKQKGEGVC